MTKRKLKSCVTAVKSETVEAILIILNSLNQGQRKKILKDEKVVALMRRYGIIYE